MMNDLANIRDRTVKGKIIAGKGSTWISSPLLGW